MDCFICTI